MPASQDGECVQPLVALPVSNKTPSTQGLHRPAEPSQAQCGHAQRAGAEGHSKRTSVPPGKGSSMAEEPKGSMGSQLLGGYHSLQSALNSRYLANKSAVADEKPPLAGCSRFDESQIKPICDATQRLIDWTRSRMTMASKQAGSRRNAAYLESAESHQQELEGYISLIAPEIAKHEGIVRRMVGLCPPEFACRLPELLRTGSLLEPLEQQQTDAAWHALLQHLQLLPEEAKKRLPAHAFEMVHVMWAELTAFKKTFWGVHIALDDLESFKGLIAKPAAKQVNARQVKPPDTIVSPEEFDASLSRSATAAAALLEEAETEKAANQQKPKLPVKAAKAAKKSKVKTKPQQPSSIHEHNNARAGELSCAVFVCCLAPSKHDMIAGRIKSCFDFENAEGSCLLAMA